LKIYFYEAFEEEVQELEKRLPNSISAEYTWKTIQECGHENPPALLISTRTQSKLPVEWADELSGILSRSTGYDHLLTFLKKCQKDVPCGHLPLYCNRSVAEQAMTLWMALFRKLPLQREHFKRFHRDGLTGTECLGKNLLVVGVGNIGYEIVRIGAGLGMEVKGVDLIQKHSSVDYVSIEQGLTWADVVVCAMNLTPLNVGYFNYNRLKEAKPGLVFVNVARGEMSSSYVLFRLLNEGHLGGVALDVYDKECDLAVSLHERRRSADPEVKASLKLAKHPNVICTPHNAFNTKESVIRKVDHTVQQIDHFRQTGKFLWPIPSE
jgi:D-lactate dehydrogenase